MLLRRPFGSRVAETLLKRLEALMAEASDEQALLTLQEVGCGHQHRPLSEVDGTMFQKKLWAAHQHLDSISHSQGCYEAPCIINWDMHACPSMAPGS